VTPDRRYGYFGPAGTFTEQALRTLPEVAADEVVSVPFDTVPLVVDAVRDGAIERGLVPVENSIEGGVSVTVDEIAGGEPVTIVGEVEIRVGFALLARPGTGMADVQRIGTHSHALAQCRRWLARVLPDAEVIIGSSTAGAASAVAEGSLDAAVAAPVAATTYGLVSLADAIEDHAGAATRFVLLSRPAPPPPPTGSDKTTIAAFIRDNHPGALMEVLDEFAVRGVDLTRLESRPSGTGLGRYSFSIDLAGHVAEARVRESLVGVRRVCADVRFLGSYPRADGEAPRVRGGTADAAFASAHAWLDGVLATGRAPAPSGGSG